MSSVIETTVGGVTTRGAGAMDVNVYYRRTAALSEAILIVAERDKGAEIVSVTGAEVRPSGKVQTQKKWITKRNEYPDGSFLRVEVNRQRPMAMGFGMDRYNIVLMPRAGAALNELKINTPVDANSSLSAVYIIGRFDVLTPEQVVARGLHLTQSGNDISDTYAAIDGIEFVELIVKEREFIKKQVIKAKTINTPQGPKIVPRLIIKRRIGLPNS